MFRPNLQNEEHRRAWEILQTVPEGQKNAFLVQVILENAQRVPQQEEAIPQEMIGFLGSLLGEE